MLALALSHLIAVMLNTCPKFKKKIYHYLGALYNTANVSTLPFLAPPTLPVRIEGAARVEHLKRRHVIDRGGLDGFL